MLCALRSALCALPTLPALPALPLFACYPLAPLSFAMLTRSGGNAPSYVYRMLNEYYHEDDFEF